MFKEWTHIIVFDSVLDAYQHHPRFGSCRYHCNKGLDVGYTDRTEIIDIARKIPSLQLAAEEEGLDQNRETEGQMTIEVQ